MFYFVVSIPIFKINSLKWCCGTIAFSLNKFKPKIASMYYGVKGSSKMMESTVFNRIYGEKYRLTLYLAGQLLLS